MNLQRRVHILFDDLTMFRQKFQDLLFDEPAEEIQLPDRGLKGFHVTCLKQYTFPATEGVKQTFAIGVQLALVVEIHQKMTSCLSKGRIHLLGVVCDKVIDKAKADGRGPLQNRKQFVKVSGFAVKLLEPTDDLILFTLNTVLDRGRTTLKGGGRIGVCDGRHEGF